MNKSKTLKINWGDTSSKHDKENNNKPYLKIGDRKKSIQIQGVEFKKSMEKYKENDHLSKSKEKIERKRNNSRSGSQLNGKNEDDDEYSSSGYYTASKSSNPDYLSNKNDLSNRKPLL